jgi:hypothetical protein
MTGCKPIAIAKKHWYYGHKAKNAYLQYSKVAGIHTPDTFFLKGEAQGSQIF